MLLGSLVIVPIWFLVYLFRPPGAEQRSSESVTAASALPRSYVAARKLRARTLRRAALGQQRRHDGRDRHDRDHDACRSR